MQFNLASLVTVTKRYALNPSISNEAFLNKLLEPYVNAGRITARGGRPFYLDKHRTSKILNGEADVPSALRKVELQHGLERRVTAECAVLFDETIDQSLASDMQGQILDLLDATTRQMSLRSRLMDAWHDHNAFMAIALIGAIATDNRARRQVEVWRSGTGSLSWTVGNLFRFGFGNRKTQRNLVVIPTNSSFDTHVTRTYENKETQRVSESTVHGQWLTRMQDSGVPEVVIRQRIDAALSRADQFTSASAGIGTLVPFETERAVYLLLAVSRFDEKGVATSSAKSVGQALLALVRWYNENGQGADLYLPLIGSGMSRSGLDEWGSYNLICKTIIDNGRRVRGRVSIVLGEDAATRLGLLD